MKILKLKKVKIGDNYPLIRIKYKTLFGTKERDVIKHEVGWMWADEDSFCLNDALLDMFNESSEFEYILNGG
jgi:hypothetical protein